MRYLLALLCLTSLPAHAAVKVTFGQAEVHPQHPVTVRGPLLQLQTAGGTTLAFQHGSRFRIESNGAVTLLTGNLRVGPAGGDTLQLNLPQGPATVAPLTALTVTANGTTSSGKVYRGALILPTQTFQSGQGFTLTQTGAMPTFTPAPAQTPPLALANRLPASEQSTPVQTVQQPEPEPQPEPPMPPQTGPEPEPTPQPEPLPVPQPEPVSEEPLPEPEPVATTPQLLSTHTTLASAVLGFSRDMSQGMAPNANAAILTLDAFSDGTFTPHTLTTSRLNLNTTRLLRNTAQVAEWASNGQVAGLARWVGGNMVAVQGATVADLANTTTTQTEDGPHTTALSLHMVWGQKPSHIPTAGTVHYTLAAATQPTYANGAPSEGASFNGSLSITFKPSYGKIGSYTFNGEVSMPEGETTTTYHMQTAAGGAALTQNAFANPASLGVTASADTATCPGGTCTGTVNIAGFGNGMKDVGALYAINPQSAAAVEGAALFSSQP